MYSFSGHVPRVARNVLAWFTVKGSRLRVMTDSSLEERLQSFIDSEGKSCSMDIGGITPLYVYRMWGGSVAIDEIAMGMAELRKNGFMGV